MCEGMSTILVILVQALAAIHSGWALPSDAPGAIYRMSIHTPCISLLARIKLYRTVVFPIQRFTFLAFMRYGAMDQC